MYITHFHKIETLGFLLLTIWGVTTGDVTVFYLIYLFWFQEFIRSIVNAIYVYKHGKQNGGKPTNQEVFGNFFLLFIYFVFIVVLFGIILNFNNHKLLGINVQTFLFRNIFFDINIIFFAITYILYRIQSKTTDLNMGVFNRNHIILHISIIVGALVQLAIIPKFPEYFSQNKLWGSALVLLPFIILKLWIGRNEDLRQTKNTNTI